MLNKQELFDRFKQETDITFKVLAALPEGKLDFKPHEKSSTVHQLLRTFMADMTIAKKFVMGEQVTDPFEGVEEFSDIASGVANLQKFTSDFLDTLNSMSDEDLTQEFSAWGTTQSRANFVLWLLFDHIHHRGQLSVYVRLAGGLVPSIYGPSADSE